MLRQDNTVIGAMLVSMGQADGMICGVSGRYAHHLQHVRDIIGTAPGCSTLAAMNHLILPGRALFICDTHVNENPDAGQLAEIALMAAETVRRFGIEPKVAMLSHSNFWRLTDGVGEENGRGGGAATCWRRISRPMVKCMAMALCRQKYASALIRSHR